MIQYSNPPRVIWCDHQSIYFIYSNLRLKRMHKCTQLTHAYPLPPPSIIFNKCNGKHCTIL